MQKRGPKNGAPKRGGAPTMTLIIFKGSTYARLTWTKLRAPRWVAAGLINLLLKRGPNDFRTQQNRVSFPTLSQTVRRFLRNAYKALNLGHRLYRAAIFQFWGCVYVVCSFFSIWTQTQVWDPLLTIGAFGRDGLVHCKLCKRGGNRHFRVGHL